MGCVCPVDIGNKMNAYLHAYGRIQNVESTLDHKHANLMENNRVIVEQQ